MHHRALGTKRTSADIDDIKSIMATLKKVFRASGIQHKDIADALEVSLMTVKRMMSGTGMKLGTLVQLCAIADITVYELIELTHRSSGTQIPMVTPFQLSALSKDFVLGTVFSLLGRGWSIDKIAQEFRLTDAEVTAFLARLDRLKVIALFPGNRIRILRMPTKISRELALESPNFASRIAEIFSPLSSTLTQQATMWNCGLARLSESSRQRAMSLLDEAAEAIFALGEQDRSLPADKVSWYATLFVAQRFQMFELMSGSGAGKSR